jgi:hypothetical protein
MGCGDENWAPLAKTGGTTCFWFFEEMKFGVGERTHLVPTIGAGHPAPAPPAAPPGEHSAPPRSPGFVCRAHACWCVGVGGRKSDPVVAKKKAKKTSKAFVVTNLFEWGGGRDVAGGRRSQDAKRSVTRLVGPRVRVVEDGRLARRRRVVRSRVRRGAAHRSRHPLHSYTERCFFFFCENTREGCFFP